MILYNNPPKGVESQILHLYQGISRENPSYMIELKRKHHQSIPANEGCQVPFITLPYFSTLIWAHLISIHSLTMNTSQHCGSRLLAPAYPP